MGKAKRKAARRGERSDLADHKRVKKRLVSPLNSSLGERMHVVDWFSGVLPEYLVLDMVDRLCPDGRQRSDRNDALVNLLKGAVPEIKGERPVVGWVSDFARVPVAARPGLAPQLRGVFAPFVQEFAGLAELFPDGPLAWVFEGVAGRSSAESLEFLRDQVRELAPRRSVRAAQAQLMGLAQLGRQGKLYFDVHSDVPDILLNFPNVPDLDMAAAVIGSMHKGIMHHQGPESSWPKGFWHRCRILASCQVARNAPLEDETTIRAIQAVRVFDSVGRVDDFRRLRDRLQNCALAGSQYEQEITKVDVVTGLASRCLRIIEDMALHPHLREGIWLSAALRMLSDSAINCVYVLNGDAELAVKYREYGAGRTKLAHRKAMEQPVLPEHEEKMERAVEGLGREAGMEKWDALVDIDLGDWDGSNSRERAISTDFKIAYDIFSNASDAVHAVWPSVRRYDVVLCREILHAGHYLPRRESEPVADTPMELALALVGMVLQRIEAKWPVPNPRADGEPAGRDPPGEATSPGAKKGPKTGGKASLLTFGPADEPAARG